MQAYLDMTFCLHGDKCKAYCHRRLTEKIKRQSKVVEIPLSTAYFKCFQSQEMVDKIKGIEEEKMVQHR